MSACPLQLVGCSAALVATAAVVTTHIGSSWPVSTQTEQLGQQLAFKVSHVDTNQLSASCQGRPVPAARLAFAHHNTPPQLLIMPCHVPAMRLPALPAPAAGAISALQFQAVRLACARHELRLPGGERAGFFLGDGEQQHAGGRGGSQMRQSTPLPPLIHSAQTAARASTPAAPTPLQHHIHPFLGHTAADAAAEQQLDQGQVV